MTTTQSSDRLRHSLPPIETNVQHIIDVTIGSDGSHIHESPESKKPQSSPRDPESNMEHDRFAQGTSHSGINGLHQRHHTHRISTSQSSFPSRMIPENILNRRYSPATTKHRSNANKQSPRRKLYTQLSKLLICGGLLLYFFLVFRGTQMLTQHFNLNNINRDHSTKPAYFAGTSGTDRGQGNVSPSNMYAPESPYAGLSHGEMNHNRMSRHLKDQTQIHFLMQKRSKDRRRRTRPTSSASQASEVSFTEKNLNLLLEEEHDQQQGKSQKSSPLTQQNVTYLCGEHAQKAASQYPGLYAAEGDSTVLNSDSRVLISGIYSNPVAFHLALMLKARCGVETIIAIDPMLPNTIGNRLRLMDQMQVLAMNVPKIVQPSVLPLVGLDPKVKKKTKSDDSQHLVIDETGEASLLNYRPTHIVHLSTPPLSGSQFSINPMSPYSDEESDPTLLALRSSMTSMEQILASIASSHHPPPHFVYGSNRDINQPKAKPGMAATFRKSTKMINEYLATTYDSLFQVKSIGMRLPLDAMYGPWDVPQSTMNQLLEASIRGESSLKNDTHHFLFYQDAAEAILAAMQFQTNSSTVFDLSPASFAPTSMVQDYVSKFLNASPVLDKDSKVSLSPNNRTLHYLGWSPHTPLRSGIARAVSWQMDKAAPFGWKNVDNAPHSLAVTGDELLIKNNLTTCTSDDTTCHGGAHFLPCASECSTRANCMPSTFDSIKALSINMTEGCDAVLYTQSLGHDVDDILLQSEFDDETEPVICNLAFVSTQSRFVNAVVNKVPPKELAKFDVSPTVSTTEKLQKLNGRLLYRGWILIWLDTPKEMSTPDKFLMKLSPGRFFSDNVMYALFIDEKFSVSPTLEDVRFLISQLRRGAMDSRSVYRDEKADEDSKPKKVKYKLSATPARRATILLSQLKYSVNDQGHLPQDTKISVSDAVKFMRYEIGEDPINEKESLAVRRQKDFYKRIPIFLNGKDLRSYLDPVYKYEMKHWIRSRWIVHDMHLEESRQLRCSWFYEHVQWGTDLDQLSFAAVMAKQEVEQRLLSNDLDDRVRAKFPENPVLRQLTDSHEWFAIEKPQNEPFSSKPLQIEEVDEENAKEDLEDEVDELSIQESNKDVKGQERLLYVRIISDHVMSMSRKAWTQYLLSKLRRNRRGN